MINYKKLANGSFQLLEDYTEDGISILSGFIWDGASIPWWLRWLVRPSDRTKEASMVHDMLYSCGNGILRKEADGIFRTKLLEDNVGKAKSTLMWLGVRCFGFLFFGGK